MKTNARRLRPGDAVTLFLSADEDLRLEALVGGQAAELVVHDRRDPRLRLSTLLTALAENIHRPSPGTRLWSQEYTPLLRLKAQSTDHHDLMLEACNPWLNAALFDSKPATSCWESFKALVIDLGLEEKWIPYPFGIFRETTKADGRFGLAPASCRRGDFVVLSAETECVLGISACPVSAPQASRETETLEVTWGSSR